MSATRDLGGDKVVRLPIDASCDELVEAVAGALSPTVASMFRTCVRGELFETTRRIAERFGVRVIPGAAHRVGGAT